MSLELVDEYLEQLEIWAAGPPKGGMGAGLHAEKYPSLTPSARSFLAEHVVWIKRALDDYRHHLDESES